MRKNIELCLIFYGSQVLLNVLTKSEKEKKLKLNVTDSFVDLTVNSNLAVKCSGSDEQLSWGYINPMSEEREYEDVGLKWINEKRNDGYESTISLHLTSFTQTGEYVCYNKNDKKSLFLFVDDFDHLLLQLNGEYFFMMSLHQGVPAVLPCIPTVSSATVTLWKEKEQIQTSKDLLYDPTFGFILKNPSNSFQGSFQCNAEYGNRSTIFYLEIEIMPETFSVPEVEIDNSNATYVLVGSNFSLICYVKIDLGITLSEEMKWTYPDKNTKRVESVDLPIKTNLRDRIISQVLTVTNVKKTDEGNYQCNATDHSGKSNYHEVYVNVYENPQLPFIKFSDGIDVITRNRGEDVQLMAQYSIFPYTETRSFWTKNNQQLAPDIEKYATSASKSEFVLDIFNLTRNDSGFYTVTAYALGSIYNKTFHLRVKDKPAVKIDNVNSSCYAPEQSYILHCLAEAYPYPNISWFWKPYCLEQECIDWNIIEDISFINNETVWTMNAVNKIISSMLLIQAKHSGHYKCRSNNEIGEAESIIPFIVTDVNDCFELFSNEISPLERDSFSLTCRASTLLFEDLILEWSSLNANSSKIFEKEEIKVTKNSHEIELHLQLDYVTKNESGNYSCIGILRNENVTKRKFIDVNVLEIKKPFFRSLLWSDSELLQASNSYLELSCYVGGTPFPTITWFRDGHEIIGNITGGKFEDNFQKLVIGRLVKEDSGIYQCLAENIAGFVAQNATLIVLSGENDLQVSQHRNTLESSKLLIVVLSGVASLLVVFFILAFGRWFYRKKSLMLKLQRFDHQLFRDGRLSVYDPNIALDDQVDLLLYDESWEFPKKNLKLGRTLGQGAFGRVVKAEAFGLNDYEVSTTVAVKMLKENSDLNQQKALIAELKILIHLGHHINIVNLMGAVTKEILRGELLVMVEYCCYGNIRQYLLRYRDNFVDDTHTSGEIRQINRNPQQNGKGRLKSESVSSSQGSTTTGIALDNPSYRDRLQSIIESDSRPSVAINSSAGRSMSISSETGSVFRNYHRVDSKEHVIYISDLICFAFQCACGMDYLASKKLIHRDLAARNVLLADDKVVKICDFGLAKDCYKYESYVKKGDGPLPIKWMAIESIRDHVFTTKSDVWSFAILLWEFFALGSNPYPGIEIDENFYKRLNSGYRMEIPEYCPDFIYRVMQDCWHENPSFRPEFYELSNILGEFLDIGTKQHYQDLNAPYMEMNRQKQKLDYSNLPAELSDKDIPYVNSNFNPELLYDHVPPRLKAISNNSEITEAADIIPMIQLETIKEDDLENKISKSDHDVSCSLSDYLEMGAENNSMNDSSLK